jgi:hypothetical protein
MRHNSNGSTFPAMKMIPVAELKARPDDPSLPSRLRGGLSAVQWRSIKFRHNRKSRRFLKRTINLGAEE